MSGSTDGHWLAQLNVGRVVAPPGSEPLREFMARLDEINALAEHSPGFVWRLRDDSGNATSIHVSADPLFLINLSVWESVESLVAFTYRSAHREVLSRRREWFETPDAAHLVLWWVPAGHIPDTQEAMERLGRLRRDGSSPDAFTFARPYDPAGRPLSLAAQRAPSGTPAPSSPASPEPSA